MIDSVGRDTYTEENSVYHHSYCLDMSCFILNMFDSFTFQGSYNITVDDTLLAQQDGFIEWKDIKRFCYPTCEEDGMFPLQIDLFTDSWPQETSWELTFDNGTLVDSVEERYYTGLNTLYSHRYCLHDACYDLTLHDYIGDGMCCSYGEGSYEVKINDDEIIRLGGEFEDSKTMSFCYPATETSSEDCKDKSLIQIILDTLYHQ